MFGKVLFKVSDKILQTNFGIISKKSFSIKFAGANFYVVHLTQLSKFVF